jgi:O-antigen/teichoic acid export membrane protein
MKEQTLNKAPAVSIGKISLLSLSWILRFFIQLIVILVLAGHLSLTDYGIYQSVWVYVSLFSIIGVFGLNSLILSSPFSDVRKWIRKNKKKSIPGLLLLNIAGSIYIFLGPTYFDLNQKILLTVLILLQNFSSIAEALHIRKGNISIIFISNIVYLSFYISIHLFVILSHYSLSAILFGICIGQLFRLIMLITMLGIENTVSDYDKNIGKKWFLLGSNEILSVFTVWFDKWLVLLLLPAAQFAIYFNGTYEIPLFSLLLSAAGSISVVHISGKSADRKENISVTFRKTSLFLSSMIFPLFSFLLFYSDSIFSFLFHGKYIESVPIFQLSCLVLPVRIINSTTGLQAWQRPDIILKGTLLDFVIACILGIIFYYLMGLKGLAFAFVVSTYFQVGYYLWNTSKLSTLRLNDLLPFKKILTLLLFALIINLIVSYFIERITSDLIRLTAGIGICTLLMLVFFGYNYKEIKHNGI